jgi:hypothetical protein
MNVADHLFPVPRIIETLPGKHAFPEGRIVVRNIERSSRLRCAQRVKAAFDGAGVNREIAGHGGKGRPPAVELQVDSAIAQEQGYRIVITLGKIELAGHDDAGLAYAVTTLAQLMRTYSQSGTLPCMFIVDWPEFERRGVMLDISRDKVPTMDTLFQLVDQFEAWKLNEFQLYTEHTFAYANHEEVWKEASPMTPAEIVELDAYCRERGVELVPNQNSFGHLERWLKHDAYVHLAECREPTEVFAWGRNLTVSRTSICPEDPGSLDLMEELFAELLPHFSSEFFNIGCDETIELGYGRSKRMCEKVGKGRVYLDFLLKLRRAAKAHGRHIQFWGDIITRYPELISELPEDMTALVWGYEEDHPFDQECAAFKVSGLDFYVCPGTSSWNSFLGRHGNATANLASAARNGAKHGAKGYLITDWGDGGHWQTFSISYPYFAYGAAISWATEANLEANLAGHLDRDIYFDASGQIGKVLLNLGKAAEISGIAPHNSTIFDPILRHAGVRLADHEVLAQLNSERLIAIETALDAELASLAGAEPACPDADQVMAEIRLAAEFASHTCKQARCKLETPNGDLGEVPDNLRTDLRLDLDRLIDRHRTLWLGRNRPGGLADSIERLEVIRACY